MTDLIARLMRQPLWQAAGEGAAAAGAPAGDGGAPPAGGEAPPPAWFDGEDFTPLRPFLSAKGLDKLDDPVKAAAKLADMASNAEKRIGRGLDGIMDRPAKDQAIPEWLRANAATLGLPEAADGYTAARPDDWPKDLPWNDQLEAAARTAAFEEGMTPAAYQRMVSLFAGQMKAMDDASTAAFTKAQGDMMAELQRDFGANTDAVLVRSRQGAQLVAERAGLTNDALEAISHLLADKTGDANVIRFMAAIGDLAGEDTLQRGNADSLVMSAADAAAKLAEFSKPGSDWYTATMNRNSAEMTRLRPEYDKLVRAATRK